MADVLIIAVGLFLLIAGAELLVRFGSLLARSLGVPPLAIGLTIVAFGTSAPELVASIAAALRPSPGIAIGNIVGSNITNVLLVAGASALVGPMAVSASALKRDGIVALGSALVFWPICALQGLNFLTGMALLFGLFAFIVAAYRSERRTVSAGGSAHSRGTVRAAAASGAIHSGAPAVGVAILGCLAGIGLLALGGRLLIDAATGMAAALGISEAVIGITVVAVGTSLPELATSTLAAFRRQSDIAVGNIIGSGVFNILGIGGVIAMLSPGPVPTRIIGIDLPIMVATTAILLAFALTGRRIGRLEGLLLLSGFVLYITLAWLAGGSTPLWFS